MANDAGAVIWHDVVVIAQKVAKHFGLRRDLRFEPILASTCARLDGDCQKETGIIRIRVHRIRKGKDGTWKGTRQALARSTILATLAHELAHLAIDEHGPEFRKFTLEVAEYIRSLGEPVGHKLHGPSFGAAYYNRQKRPKPKKRRK